MHWPRNIKYIAFIQRSARFEIETGNFENTALCIKRNIKTKTGNKRHVSIILGHRK